MNERGELADLGAGEPAQRVQQGLQRALGHVVGRSLLLLLRQHLLEVVDVEQDAVQVHLGDVLREEPVDPPQTLERGKRKKKNTTVEWIPSLGAQKRAALSAPRLPS